MFLADYIDKGNKGNRTIFYLIFSSDLWVFNKLVHIKKKKKKK
jgi:hypothetical protein